MNFWEQVFAPVTALKAVIPSARDFSASVPTWQNGVAQFSNNRYETYAREGYMKNEIVYQCIDERATTAAEPRLVARSGETWRTEGQILDLMHRPNPFMDHFEFWATIIMHLDLAGNAYALKVRSASGRVVELWLMRPDRVKVVPSSRYYISHYTFDIGDGEPTRIPAEDVIHWKTRHPVDDWYGMPPLMPASGRTDIENYMKDFVKSSFLNQGVPAAMLSIKQKMSPDDKIATERRFREQFAGPDGWHRLLILDNAEASYTPLSMELGQRGLVLPELHDMNVESICSTFHVFSPLLGYMKDAGGYNSLDALERHWWTSTVIPLYKSLAGPLNLRLIPDFPRVSELKFDMSDVVALQPNMDAVARRWGLLYQLGVASHEESRENVGLSRNPNAADVFSVPTAAMLTVGADLDDPPEPVAVPARGRPTTQNDPEARSLWAKGEELRAQFPAMTNEQLASRLGVSVTTYWRYKRAFEN